MKRKFISLFSCSVFFVSCAWANAHDTSGQEFTNIFKKTTTLRADFLQKQIDPQGVPIFSGSGRVVIKKPDQFLWETLTPTKQLILADSKTLWVYDADLKQVTTYPQSKNLGSTPAAILSGQQNAIAKNYRIVNLNTATKNKIPKICHAALQNKTSHDFCLIPQDKENSLKAIVINFIDNKPNEMVLMDQLNQITQIQFNNVLINQPVMSNMFKFQLPKDVEIIKSE